MKPIPQAIQLPTKDLYNAWSKTYDTDENVLQKIDDEAFISSVPKIISAKYPITLLDLGCGTGRNTTKIASILHPGSSIFAVDFSEGMLSIAKEKLKADIKNDLNVRWIMSDIMKQRLEIGSVDVVISTLVLEHFHLDVFFKLVAGVLKKGGWAYISNMHPEMGASRASFVKSGGVKVHGESWNHGIEETVNTARTAGLLLVGSVDERGVVDSTHAKNLGQRADKWIGRNIFFGMNFVRE